MNRLLSIAFWSVIAAAFIGPGTVAACAAAGAGYGTTLLWALGFSTLACLTLQEASARLTVVSGLTLGQALRRRFRGGVAGAAVLMIVCGAILLGCAAYEAGNILGGVQGARLAVGLSESQLTLLCGGAAALLLWLGTPRRVALLLSVLVAVMGIVFLVTAVLLSLPVGDLFRGLIAPIRPPGSGLVILGLVGTTVVPYNLFLGSGLAAGRELGETRFGLAVAVLLGGLISMAVLVVGTAISGELTFSALAGVLADRLGPWARPFFALGLFGAGFSSAVTAPLAAALTARSLFAAEDAAGSGADPRWGDRSWRYRLVWGGVLGVGVLFGMFELRPIPVILAAQAFNGILLPLAAVFLLVAVNDRELMGDRANGPGLNLLAGLVTLIATGLGLLSLWKVGTELFGA